MDPVIPDKMYFKIGEVSEITGLEAHVLRFWESEFKNIKPRRTSTGQRMYRKNDIQLILYIKHLLHNEKFTIQGARKYLENEAGQSRTPPTAAAAIDVNYIRSELEQIKKMLES
ncbi:MerR family transcriptional regulator [Desulfatiferula olefinivorans]